MKRILSSVIAFALGLLLWGSPARATVFLSGASECCINLQYPDFGFPDVFEQSEYLIKYKLSQPTRVHFRFQVERVYDFYDINGFPIFGNDVGETTDLEFDFANSGQFYLNFFGPSDTMGVFLFGAVRFTQYYRPSSDIIFDWLDAFDEDSNFTPLKYSIRVTRINPVPEPETWLLLSIGTAIAGAALRRRRSTIAL